MNKLIQTIKLRNISGRWFLGGSHIALVVICLLFYNLQRSALQMIFGFAIGFLTELLFYKYTNKYSKNKIWDRLFSAATETAGLLVLLKSHSWWFYGFLSFITIAAKYLLRKDENNHIFNPTNFSITVALLFFPITMFGAWSDEYMMVIYPMIHVTLFGILAVYLGKTYIVSISYIVSIIFWCMVFFPFHSTSSIVYALGPEFGAIGLIFTWLMITDPRTAPSDKKMQVIYAFSIAFIHIFMRYNQILYSRYISLFIVTLIFYALYLFKSSKRFHTA